MSTSSPVKFTSAPLAQIAAAFAVGVLTAQHYRPSLSKTLIVGALFAIVALVSLLKGRHNGGGMFLLLAMFSSGLALGELDIRITSHHELREFIQSHEVAPHEQVTLTGVVDGPVDLARERAFATVHVDQIRFRAVDYRTNGEVSLLINLPGSHESEPLEYGDRIRVAVVLNIQDQFRNPGVSQLSEYLDRQGLDASAFVKSSQSLTLLERPGTRTPMNLLLAGRRQLQAAIDERFDAETAAVIDAAFLGNRYNLTRDISDRFRAGGTFHVLVISGLHITFLGAIVLLLARLFTTNSVVQFLSGCAVVWGYSLAVGGGPSVSRAALMFTFVSLGQIFYRQATSLNALGASALILLIRRPQDLFDPSLQLTFLSVLAIVVLAWPLIQKLAAIGGWRPTRLAPHPPACSRWLIALAEIIFWSERRWQVETERSAHSCKLPKSHLAIKLERWCLQKMLRYCFCAVAVSICVQLTLLPFLVVYFHRLSLCSIILNIGVSLLLAVLALVAAIALLFSQLSLTLAAPFVFLANELNWLLVHSVDPFVKLGLDSFRLGEYSGALRALYFCYYLPLVVLAVSIRRWDPFSPGMNSRALLRSGLLVGIGSLVIFHPGSVPQPDGRLHFEFLDVGQGDAALVTAPDGTTLLVDGGGRPQFGKPGSSAAAREVRSIGETVVSEYLWWHGLDHVDYVLATHADADHIDGLNDVVRNFSVRAGFVARKPENDPEYVKFAESLRDSGTDSEVLEAGDIIQFGGATVSVYWPEQNVDPGAPSGNDDSIVLRFALGTRAVLLTGDIEKRAETALTRASNLLSADVVKVPHHGSRTSSTEQFVTATGAGVAVISVGRTSPFGHPHREVVERWEKSGARVFTTGRCGTISVSTNGCDLQVTTFAPCD